MTNSIASLSGAGSILAPDQIIYFFRTLPVRLIPFLGAWTRRRRRSWGTVFSDTTQQPIPRAFVQLHRQQFGKVVKGVLTDSQGRFWFLISSPGEYFISVQKPSFKDFIGRKFRIVDVDSLPLNQRIYLKPAVFEEKIQMIRFLAILLKVLNFLDRFRIPLLVLGSITAIINLIILQGLWQYLIILFYILFWIIEIVLYLVPRPFGRVTSGGQGLSMAIVRVVKANQKGRPVRTYVTDQQGRFHFLLGRGNYQFKVTKPGYRPYISPVYRFKNLATQPRFVFQLKRLA
jgi:predicted nucleic acid-binding Zn finger protein